MIREAEKYQDLQSASWRLRREVVWYSSYLKLGMLKIQEELILQFKSQGRERPISQLKYQAVRVLSWLLEGQLLLSLFSLGLQLD